MSDKPRSIIMPNDPETTIVSTDKLVLTPDEVKDRIEKKSKARYSGPNKYNISRDEAVSIAVQIGQEVYDQLRAEHALAMGELQKDLKHHFGEIRHVTAANILDLQRRSFSYRIRRDFDVDLQRMAAKLRDWWGWWQWRLDLVRAWLELHGFRATPAPTGDPGDYPETLFEEAQNVGAPSELPEPPEVARAFTLSSQGKQEESDVIQSSAGEDSSSER